MISVRWANINDIEDMCKVNTQSWLTTYEMTIKPEYFELVKAGIKKYEVRTNDDRRKKMHVGDVIRLINESENKEELRLKIINKIEFPTFTKLYDSLPKRDVGFEGRTTESIVNELRRFYSEELEKQLGVVAIEVEVEPVLDKEEVPYVKKITL